MVVACSANSLICEVYFGTNTTSEANTSGNWCAPAAAATRGW
jgi:hypothetical protein